MPEFLYDYTLNNRRLSISRTYSTHCFHVRWTEDKRIIEDFMRYAPIDNDVAMEEYLYAVYKLIGE